MVLGFMMTRHFRQGGSIWWHFEALGTRNNICVNFYLAIFSWGEILFTIASFLTYKIIYLNFNGLSISLAPSAHCSSISVFPVCWDLRRVQTLHTQLKKMVRLRSNFSTTTPIRTTGSQSRSLSDTAPRAASTLSGATGASTSDPKDETITGRMRQLSLTSSDEVSRGGSILHFEVIQS